jgi:phospholipid/cholesterol/gamma-HCH transport system permease protein
MADVERPGTLEKNAGDTEIQFDRQGAQTLLIRLSGRWTIRSSPPAVEALQTQLDSFEDVRRVAFDTGDIADWDSSLLTFLMDLHLHCTGKNIAVETDGLPEGVARLIALATAVPERKGARRQAARDPFLVRLGGIAVDFWQGTSDLLVFIGEAVVAFSKFMLGKASFRRSDWVLFVQECGADALPIVALISFLVGLILAFVGAVQLLMFGAQLYVADLVGIAMVRVLGAVMTGVVMAGRTGAAFAAQLGTMQVNEEIDALQTMGISPMEFLVLPRMLAMVLMMPILCVFADLMGLLGGMAVGVGMLDIGVTQYISQTRAALNLNHFFIGIIQSVVFGVLVALSGCLRGMACGRSASAVGDATTSAVVTSIVAITVATAVITLVCNVLGI